MIDGIRITRNTIIKGKQVKVDDELLVPDQCSDKDARFLININKAVDISDIEAIDETEDDE